MFASLRSKRSSFYSRIGVSTGAALALLAALLATAPYGAQGAGQAAPNVITSPTGTPTGVPTATPTGVAVSSLGTWAGTGSLATARVFVTPVKLQNGNVLVAGGCTSSTCNLACHCALTSAELYNPASGTWAQTGALTSAHGNYDAVLLSNGKVLLVGGTGLTGTAGATAITELYDPSSGTWSATGSMASARTGPSIVLLASGKVLVVGGFNGSAVVSTAEIYDPSTGNWTATGSPAKIHFSGALRLLSNGKVLLAGGSSTNAVTGDVSAAELFDEGAGTWSATGAMSIPRGVRNSHALSNGKILVAGGVSNGSTTASTDLYDAGLGTWSPGGSMTSARNAVASGQLSDGRVLIAGGTNGSSTLSSSELYDSGTNTWTSAGPMISPRQSPGKALLLSSGGVLVAGGLNGTTVLSSAEIFTPAAAPTPAAAATATPTPTLASSSSGGGGGGSTTVNGVTQVQPGVTTRAFTGGPPDPASLTGPVTNITDVPVNVAAGVTLTNGNLSVSIPPGVFQSLGLTNVTISVLVSPTSVTGLAGGVTASPNGTVIDIIVKDPSTGKTVTLAPGPIKIYAKPNDADKAMLFAANQIKGNPLRSGFADNASVVGGIDYSLLNAVYFIAPDTSAPFNPLGLPVGTALFVHNFQYDPATGLASWDTQNLAGIVQALVANPVSYVQTVNPNTQEYSSFDPNASQSFGGKPQFSYLQVVAPQIPVDNRLVVLDPDTGNYSYVNATDVSPSGPPPPKSSSAVVRGLVRS